MRKRLLSHASYAAALVLVAEPVPASTLAAGADHSLGIKVDGTVWAWGANHARQLGQAQAQQVDVPQQVPGVSRAVSVAAGDRFSVALDELGRVFTWGDNSHGQLGDGASGGFRSDPREVPGLSEITEIAAGRHFVLAKGSDGTIWAWGENSSGQLGDGTTSSRRAPVRVRIEGGEGLEAVLSIAAGGQHSIALLGDGTVWCWGANDRGQVGPLALGAQAPHPVQVRHLDQRALREIRSVVATAAASFAVDEGGTVYAWGSNQAGELGVGEGDYRAHPLPVAGLNAPVEVLAAGRSHVLAIDVSGSLWTWGSAGSMDSRSALPTERLAAAPTILELGRTRAPILEIAAGAHHNLAIQDGRPAVAWAWGTNSHGQLGGGPAAESGVEEQVLSDGFAWTVRTPRAAPHGGVFPEPLEVAFTSRTPEATVRYTSGEGPDDPGPLDSELGKEDLVKVDQSTAVKARAWADGLAPSGVAQVNYLLRVEKPAISLPSGTYRTEQVVAISSATPEAEIRYTHDGREPTETSTLYKGPIRLRESAKLVARGYREGWEPSEEARADFAFEFGELPPPSFEPPAGTYVSSVEVRAAGSEGAVVRYTDDGSDPTEASPILAGPIRLEASRTLRARAFQRDWRPSRVVAAQYLIQVARPELKVLAEDRGAFTLLAYSTTPGAALRYTVDGRVPTAEELLVEGGRIRVDAPAQVRVLATKDGCLPSEERSLSLEAPSAEGELFGPCQGPLTRVSAGGLHSLLLKSDGTVWSWGDNSGGQLGDGTTQDRLAPVQVPGLPDIVSISASAGFHSLALDVDGTVWAWGANSYGQLGDGTQTARSAPIQLPGLEDIVEIATGASFSVALRADGIVFAWGANSSGQLGDGTTTHRASPTQVPSLSGVASIAAGENHTLARKSNGEVWAWGYNGTGQLGNGSTTNSSSPVSTGLVGVAAVAAGGDSSFAKLTGPALMAWGANINGTLGDGTTTNRTSPVYVLGSEATAVVGVGDGFALFGRVDGAIWAVGSNGFGALGDGTTSNRTSQAPISANEVFPTFGAGPAHNLALSSDGSVWSWGWDTEGQLGDGRIGSYSTIPNQVSDSSCTWRAALPAFSPAPQTSTLSSLAVALSTTTSGGTIRYTTDGSEPTEASTAYSVPINVVGTTTVRARTYKTGMPESSVHVGVYTMKVATPTFSATGGSSTGWSVTISDLTPSAEIRYTTDGSPPTASSTLYTAPISVMITTSIRAKAFRSDRVESDEASHNYGVNLGTLTAPLISPGTGTYISSQSAALSAEAGATIRYTLDGSTPTEQSAEYTAAFLVEATKTIKARAFRPGYTASSVTTATYTIKVATPTIDPGAGNYSAGQIGTVSTSTPGATIHFTITGTTPTTADRSIATSPPIVLGNYTLKALAVKAGCSNSDVASAAFTITGNVAGSVPNLVEIG